MARETPPSMTNNSLPAGKSTHQYISNTSFTVTRTVNGARLTGTGAQATGDCPPTYSAVINFVCDERHITPVFVNTLDNYQQCYAEFDMVTRVACGVKLADGEDQVQLVEAEGK